MTKKSTTRKYYRVGILTICSLLAIGVLGLCIYKFILPTVIASTITGTGETVNSMLPQTIVQKIDHYKKPINHTAEEVLYEMDSLHIPFDLILRYVDNVKKETIIKTYDEVVSQKTMDRNKIFDIVKKNIQVTEFDTEILRSTFLKLATPERISRGMNYIKLHHLLDEIDVSLSREVIKKILIQKKDEINKRLQAKGGVQILIY